MESKNASRKRSTYEHQIRLLDAWQEQNPKTSASYYLLDHLLQMLPQPNENNR